MSFTGLPPLPKSLTGVQNKVNQQPIAINIAGSSKISATNSNMGSSIESSHRGTPQPHHRLSRNSSVSSAGGNNLRSPTESGSESVASHSLDNQLAVLRKEMLSLRQLDLKLLSQLWALNESIQEFRVILQDNDGMSPASPTSSQSDGGNSMSSDEDDMSTPTSTVTTNNQPVMPMPTTTQATSNNSNFGGAKPKANYPPPVPPQKPQVVTTHRMRRAPPPPPPARKPPQRPV